MFDNRVIVKESTSPEDDLLQRRCEFWLAIHNAFFYFV
jgi:hypothetical protein